MSSIIRANRLKDSLKRPGRMKIEFVSARLEYKNEIFHITYTGDCRSNFAVDFVESAAPPGFLAAVKISVFLRMIDVGFLGIGGFLVFTRPFFVVNTTDPLLLFTTTPPPLISLLLLLLVIWTLATMWWWRLFSG